jgi:hypothetical protein
LNGAVRQAKLTPPPARFACRKYFEFEGHQTILAADPGMALEPDDSCDFVS